MKYSIMVEPQLGGTYADLLRIARLAEDSEMVSLARSDHLTWNVDPRPDATDAFATLGGLALRRAGSDLASWSARSPSAIRPSSPRTPRPSIRSQVVASNDDAPRVLLEEKAAASSESVSDYVARVTERGWLVGTPGQVGERIAALEEVGVERIYIQWFSRLSDYDGLAKAVEVIAG